VRGFFTFSSQPAVILTEHRQHTAQTFHSLVQIEVTEGVIQMQTTLQRPTAERPTGTLTLIGILVTVNSLLFFLWATLHLGLALPLGAVTLSEPFSLPAAFVESLCGLALAIGAFALFTRKDWAWTALFNGHLFAFGGVMLGMFALALVPGPRSLSNDIYHNFALIFLVTTLVLLQRPAVRATLEREE
jgi:hypothetical protein